MLLEIADEIINLNQVSLISVKRRNQQNWDVDFFDSNQDRLTRIKYSNEQDARDVFATVSKLLHPIQLKL